MVTTSSLVDQVNWREGLVSPSVHFDEGIYDEEQRQVFGRAWLCVGHEDMVRKPGDFVTNYMGEVPVIVLRDFKGQLRVMQNKCAHRGNLVCLFDRGNARAFTCAYHGWTYDLDGTLIGLPQEKEAYRNELDKSAWGLQEVPHFANLKGLLFASFDPNAPPLEQWLGEDTVWWLTNFVLSDYIGGLEMLPGFHRYVTSGNWKLLAENFIGDNYHVATTHASFFKALGSMPADYEGRRNNRAVQGDSTLYTGTAGESSGAPFGMGRVALYPEAYERDLESAQDFGPKVVDWVRERSNLLLKALGDREIKPYCFNHGGLFPNLGLISFVSATSHRGFLSFHPRGPEELEQWQWAMVEREAPESVKEAAVHRANKSQHMAGCVAPDDGENFERMVESSHSSVGWTRPFHYGMNLGHEDEGPKGIPSRLSPEPSDLNQRNFYRYWLEMMNR